MTRSSATAGGTVVSWVSLDDQTARMMLLPDSLHTGWAWLPFFSERYGAYYFFVGHPLASLPPPVENPELGPLDAAMIATLQASLADMNQRVADSIARSRNSPPPAPPDPLSKKFWRIKADWGLDSDADGSPDWVEFAAAAANPAGVAGLRADAFDADTDHNAVLDGNQLDSDNDGIPDHQDGAPRDPSIATSIFTPRWRYAVFPVPAAKGPSNEDLEPRMINAQGKVLFPLSFWRQGAFTPLITDNPGEISGCIALAMTDAGQVLGGGMAQRFEPAGVSGSSGWAATPPLVCAWWENPAVTNPAENPVAKPIIVQTPERFAKPALLTPPPDNPALPAFPFDSLLANDTRFMANHTETTTVAGQTHTVETRALWRKTATGFSFTDDERYAQDGYDMFFVGGTDYVWGWQGTGSRLLSASGDHDFTYPVSRIPMMPAPTGHAGVPVGFGTFGVPDGRVPDPTPGHPDNYAWKPQPKLAGGRDVSSTGVRLVGNMGMAQDVQENILEHWAPGIPAALQAPQFKHAADNGWFLARLQVGAQSLVGMPVLFEDDTEATGADSFSLGGRAWYPVAGAQEKSWVMVPLSGNTTTLKLRSLATTDNPLTLESPLLDFGGGNTSVTVTQDQAPLSLNAKAGANLASGAEVNLGLRLGTADCVSHPLAGYVMKARTVKVNVYKVVKQTPGLPDNPPDLIVTPAGEPDFKTQLETYLNDVFKPQLNTTFQVTVIATPLTLNWDLGTASYPDGDDTLNLNTDKTKYSDEQLKILAVIPTPAPASNIDVFMLGTSYQIDSNGWGATTTDQRTCWMVGDAVTSGRTLAKLKFDTAHEIGHVMVGPGHPDYRGGPAPLPGTDHHRRLMNSGFSQGTDPGHLLVKAEWEAAEAWMKNEEGEERMPK